MTVMKEHAAGMKAVIHCYSYSVEMAREYVKMGYYIGVGGVVTFKNAKKLKTVVEEIPLERILLEDRLPVSGACALPGKEKFIFESSLCGGGNCGAERNNFGRSHTADGEECKRTVWFANILKILCKRYRVPVTKYTVPFKEVKHERADTGQSAE